VTTPRARAEARRAQESAAAHTPFDGMDDRALVARVAEGDDGALEALYARYGRSCYGLARRSSRPG
jgi:hypothetical protein